MKKYLISSLLFALVFAGVHSAFATSSGVAGAEVFAKKNPTAGCIKCLATTTTDSNGQFNFKNLDSGTYDIYYGNETLPPIGHLMIMDGTISGTLSVTFNTKPVSFIYGSWSPDQITALKNILVAQGTLAADAAALKIKTADFADAIKAFQKKYGIALTGQLGPKTVAKLNELINKHTGNKTTLA